jgi:hypothetical protein
MNHFLGLRILHRIWATACIWQGKKKEAPRLTAPPEMGLSEEGPSLNDQYSSGQAKWFQFISPALKYIYPHHWNNSQADGCTPLRWLQFTSGFRGRYATADLPPLPIFRGAISSAPRWSKSW